MTLSRGAFSLPITAVGDVYTFTDSILWIGEGSFVKLYLLQKSTFLCSLKVFESQAVHGIACFERTNTGNQLQIFCGVWGGRCTSFLQLTISTKSDVLCVDQTHVFQEQRLPDWILHAVFVRNKEDNRVELVLLDAHDNLFIVQTPYHKDDVNQAQPSLLSIGPPSALYSGYIKCTKRSCILVAAGTVFGGVHLWVADTSKPLGYPGELIIVYSGHEGSVFDIQISDISFNSGIKSIIITCSDDRTVKIWDIPTDMTDNYSNPSWKGIQTGFDRLRIDGSSIPPSTSAIGHLSRIWRVSTFDFHSNIGIITFGEDATAQMWVLDEHKESKQLILSKGMMLNLHTGKNIWAGKIIESGLIDQHFIVTGGADGRITLNDLSVDLGRTSRILCPPVHNHSGGVQSIRGYCWLDCTTLLAVSSDGSVYLRLLEDEDGGKGCANWKYIGTFSGFARHVLLQAVGINYVLMTGSTGSVYLFSRKDSKLNLLLQIGGKISFIHAAGLEQYASGGVIAIAIQCLGSSEFHIIELYLTHYKNEEIVKKSISLPSAFVVMCVHHISSRSIAVGSRNGNIAIIHLSDDGNLENCYLIDEVHGKEAVTSITKMQSSDWLLSTGRDGHFKIHHMVCKGRNLSWSTIHATKLPFGPDIEGARFIEQQLQIWGFKGEKFVLWSHSLQQELISIDCGGRHRNWALHHGQISVLAWTRGGNSHTAQLTCGSKLLQPGSHGREIKAIAIRNNSDDTGMIIATGAEDTCIRLSRYDPQDVLKVLDVLPNHNTGLQKLAWSEDGRFLFSAAGKEEFFIWNIQSVPILEIGVRLIAKAPQITDTQILRIMDFEIIEKGDLYILLMVYSDSSIRLWKFDPAGRFVKLLTETAYTSRCLTQCKVLGEYFLTAATDGRLALWNLFDLSLISTKHVHRSSVKCLDTVLWGHRIMIATGGDDNALALTILDVQPAPTWHTLIIPRSHASAINALLFLPGVGSEVDLITTGNDQRVKSWRLLMDPNSQKGRDILVRRLGNDPSSVADSSCMSIWKDGNISQILIAGVGLETWGQDL